MTPSNDELREELLSLLGDYCDGTIEPAAGDRLESILRESESARNHYVEYLDLHLALRKRTVATLLQITPDATTIPSSNVVPPSQLPTVPPSPVLGLLDRATATLSRPVLWATLAAGVLFVAYVVTISWNMLGKQVAQELGVGSQIEDSPWRKSGVNVVATIRDTADTQWSSDSSPLAPDKGRGAGGEGADIIQGAPLKLDSGLVELQLKQGATLLIEGPAEWSIDGDNRATLNKGKLVAKVPTQAVGFTLDTPTGRIVDLGTEFGVVTAATGTTQVHVLLGTVDVQPAIGGDAAVAPIRLKAGEAIRLKAGDTTLVESISIERSAFAQLSPAASVKRPLERWREASERFRHDPDLVAFYDFERAVDSPNQLLNRAASTAGKLNGTLGRADDAESVPTWTNDGRWRGKGAFYFAATKHQFATVAHAPELNLGEHLTIAAWVRPDQNFSHGVVAAKRSGEGSEYQLGLFGDFPQPDCARRIQYETDQTFLLSDPVVPPGDRWMHLAVTRNASRVEFFLNGQSAGVHETSHHPKSLKADLHLGIDLEPGGNTFPGAIDEVLIFRRALSQQEIAAMHKEGEP